jgi:hypothetical protein
MDGAITIAFYLLDSTWPFVVAIIGLMVGSALIARVISYKDIHL